jgi:hypothetical protein
MNSAPCRSSGRSGMYWSGRSRMHIEAAFDPELLKHRKLGEYRCRT